MIQAPIFHVNGDDPEACVRVAELAYEFRQEFDKDVVIDMVCYRRRGHNEGDDPSMTQPLMYNLIEAKRSVRKLYTEALIGRGDITVEEAEAALRDYQQQLERVFVETRRPQGGRPGAADAATRGTDVDGHAGLERPRAQAPTTPTPRALDDRHRDQRRGAPAASATPSSTSPDGFTVHPKLRAAARAARRDGARRRHRLGAWASCSPSARCSSRARRSASPVRTPGAARSCSGTRCSSTRSTAAEWTPLLYLGEDQAPVLGLRLAAVASSPRWASSTATPSSGPTPWCCGRRSSATSSTARRRSSTSSSPRSEQKWGQRSSVVLLLPHGYEGQGPDHSSARIERFLQMCAEDNMTVAYPSTPGVVLPPAAPAGLRPAAPAADRLHPEVDAAPQGRGQRASRTSPRAASAR